MANSVSRYENAALISAGQNVYLGRRPMANTLPRGDDQFVTTAYGDNWHTLAWRILGDQRLWWVLCDFNDIGDPTVDPVTATVLRAPSRQRLWMEILA